MKRIVEFLLLGCWLFAVVGCGDEPVIHEAVSEEESLPGGETTETLAFVTQGIHALSSPFQNISDDHHIDFFSGRSFFRQNWVAAPASTEARDGLGPLFNARACETCHGNDGRGRPTLETGERHQGFLLRLSVHEQGQEPTPDPQYGGQLQDLSNPGVPAEGTIETEYEVVEGAYDDGTPYTLLRPTHRIVDLGYGPLSDDIRISPRVAPAMTGMGLLEAIAEEDLLALADPDDEDGNGVSGRAQEVWDVRAQSMKLGRFGWKAEEPTVEQQVAGAFLGDMGLTSSLFPESNCSPNQQACNDAISGGDPEVSERILHDVTLYSSALAPPIRPEWDQPQVLEGRMIFYGIGCADCHTPSHRTGEHSGLPEASHQLIWPYTDLLLHDMGEALSDERPVGQASGNEWRTPPLWGVGHYETVNGHKRLLHDGRARGVAEAILWHGGEAESTQQSFKSLSPEERDALVRFVESL